MVGVKEFGNIKHDFTYDNTVKAASGQASESKSSKFKSRTKKYSDIICTPFNREVGCRLPCSFLHACMFCETTQNGIAPCTRSLKTVNRKLVFHTRKGASRAVPKVLAIVTSPPGALVRPIRPKNPKVFVLMRIGVKVIVRICKKM